MGKKKKSVSNVTLFQPSNIDRSKEKNCILLVAMNSAMLPKSCRTYRRVK